MSAQKKQIFPVLAAFWTATAIALSGEFVNTSGFLNTVNAELGGIRLDKLIVLLALIFFYRKTWEAFRKTRKWITHLIAAFFALFMLIGISYSTQGSWVFILGNKKQSLIAALAFVGYFFLFDVALCVLYRFLEQRGLRQAANTRPLPAFMEKHGRLSAFWLIYLCWLPWIIVFFPGSVPADGYRQLDMYFGGEAFTTRHAWILTMFVGLLMSIGRQVSDNMGVFLIILVTSLIECFCYAIVCEKIKKWKAPKRFYVGSILFFGIMPMFGAYAQTVIKDSVFTAFFALFMALYVDYILQARGDGVSHPVLQLLLLSWVGFLVCITRNNGIYMVFAAMVLLFFLVAGKKKLLALLLAVVIFGGYNVSEKVVAPALGISSVSSRVYFSIPFQQTARYLACYPEDVTEEEAEAIDGILNYEQLASRYNPELSDPVKATYRTGKITKEKLVRYFKAWLSMFKKHPGVYIEATLHNTYGYYYPFYHNTAQGPYRFYMRETTNYSFDYAYVMPNAVRRVMSGYAYLWRRIPGLAQVCNSGAYTWLLMILAGYLIYKKRWRGILVLAAPFLNVAVCIASPVNGMFRYVFPLVACTPVVIYWCLRCGQEGEGKVRKA